MVLVHEVGPHMVPSDRHHLAIYRFLRSSRLLHILFFGVALCVNNGGCGHGPRNRSTGNRDIHLTVVKFFYRRFNLGDNQCRSSVIEQEIH